MTRPPLDSFIQTQSKPPLDSFVQPSSKSGQNTQTPGLLDKLGGRMSDIGTAWTQHAYTGQQVLGTAGAVAGGINDVIGSIVSPVINYGVDKASDIGALQNVANNSIVSGGIDATNNVVRSIGQKYADFKHEHPILSKAAEDVGNIVSLIPAGKAATVAQDTISPALNTVSKKVGESTFNANLNKALPVLKKDVKMLPIKQADARTALGDIVANKDTVGVLDASGLPKNPSKYTFTDTVQAQSQRLKQLYTDYTARLSSVDQAKFDESIHKGLFDQLDQLHERLVTENSMAKRSVLSKISKEIGSLRDTTPEGIQKYIESINQITKTAPGHPPNVKQIEYANLGGELRKILDESVTKIDGQGYQDLRNVYKAHKTIESQLLQAAKSELNKTPGWTDRIANIGLTAEGASFLISHDPAAIAGMIGIKGSTAFMKWMRSPQGALQRMFKHLENTQKPSALSASNITQTAKQLPKNTNILQTIPQEKALTSGGVDMSKNSQGGYIANPIAKKSKGVPKTGSLPSVPRFPAEVKSNIVKIIDDYRLHGGKDLTLQQDAARIAEDYNIPMPKNYGALVSKLQQILEGQDRYKVIKK